ncbi:hypothetical protein ACE939_05010 [Aquimarina sp. W85]|uniref:hypothetical protein n=1 Tax=Aquimarina rhodophyticola TaxID=3342246 RepID=UPI00366D646E
MDVNDYPLHANDRFTQIVRSKGIITWLQLLQYVRQLPYERITDSSNPSLILIEQKGTCSSKHAFLKQIADFNDITVDLVVGIYKMTEENTPGIGKCLKDNNLNYIPEAHCYLKKSNRIIDVTNMHNNHLFAESLLEEINMTADQVSIYKITYHQNFIKKWLTTQKDINTLTFDEVWRVREQCIKNLSRI